ncbi:unnamed protein product, partial [Dibothriocephalus latus]
MATGEARPDVYCVQSYLYLIRLAPVFGWISFTDSGGPLAATGSGLLADANPGFTLMGLPSVKVDPSTAEEELLPERLLDSSAPPASHVLVLRTRLVLQNFRWLATEFPSLLSWRETDSLPGGAFEVVNRDAVSLPTVAPEKVLNAHE